MSRFAEHDYIPARQNEASHIQRAFVEINKNIKTKQKWNINVSSFSSDVIKKSII